VTVVAPSAAARSRSRRTAELSCASSRLSVRRVSPSCTARISKKIAFTSWVVLDCSGSRKESVTTPSNWLGVAAAGRVRFGAPGVALRTTRP
jgi:hypothetical protein